MTCRTFSYRQAILGEVPKTVDLKLPQHGGNIRSWQDNCSSPYNLFSNYQKEPLFVPVYSSHFH